MSTATRPLRADAERNRLRILDAAGTLFAERGLDVSIEEIAAAAGVGVGTVYRRFEDREALIDALFEGRMDAVAEVAREALEIEDPWDGLEHFIRGATRLNATDRGLKEALLSSDRGRQRVAASRDCIRPLAQEIFARAKAAGVLREDLDDFDVPMLHHAIGYVADRTRCTAPDYYERLVTIMLDGLRPRRDDITPMPQPPLDPEQFERGLARR